METILELQQRLREKPADPETQLGLARALLQEGKAGDALFYLRLAEASASHRGEVRHLMGLAHLDCGDIPEAVMDLMAAARALPDDAAVAAALDLALERLTEPGFVEEEDGSPPAEPAEWAAAPEDGEGDEPALGLAPVAAPEGALSESPSAVSPSSVSPPSSPPTGEQLAGQLTRRESASVPGHPPPAGSSRPGEGDSNASSPPVLDLVAIREELVRARASQREAPQQTILVRGRAGGSRKTALWTAAFFLVGALTFGAVATYRLRSPAVPDTAESAASSSGTESAEGGSRGEAPPPAGAPARPREAVPVDDEREAGALLGADGLAATAEPGPADELPNRQREAYDSSPSYPFMARLGLEAPPGGVLDTANSDSRSLLLEGRGPAPGQAVVLTFRTAASVQDVVDHYEARAGDLRFSRRVVPMGGKFQGVQREVARARGAVGGGREAIVTVSRPGIDRASLGLVEETSVRIEVR